MRGRFITIEGLEGAGKSSAIRVVRQSLLDAGIERVITTREPGGTPIAEALRNLCKQKFDHDVWIPESELLVMYAARVQLVRNVIQPALERGTWVIGDRHELSTRAYQGGGREIADTVIDAIYHAVLKDFKPDLTLYLDVCPSTGLTRVDSRGERDRIESESLEFFHRVREYYKRYAQLEPSVILIDANQDMSDVHLQIKQHIKNYLG